MWHSQELSSCVPLCAQELIGHYPSLRIGFTGAITFLDPPGSSGTGSSGNLFRISERLQDRHAVVPTLGGLSGFLKIHKRLLVKMRLESEIIMDSPSWSAQRGSDVDFPILPASVTVGAL